MKRSELTLELLLTEAKVVDPIVLMETPSGEFAHITCIGVINGEIVITVSLDARDIDAS